MAYCERSNIEAAFGSANVLAWATLASDDSDETIAARIARAIAVGDAKIDAFFRQTHYRVPLVTSAGATPTLIEEMSAIAAGLWLHDVRGMDDHVDVIAGRRKWLEETEGQIKAGVLRLDAI